MLFSHTTLKKYKYIIKLATAQYNLSLYKIKTANNSQTERIKIAIKIDWFLFLASRAKWYNKRREAEAGGQEQREREDNLWGDCHQLSARYNSNV